MKKRTAFNAGILACTTILAAASGSFAADRKPSKKITPAVASKPAPAAAPRKVAVSAPNGSVDFGAGVMETHGAAQIAAVGSLPVTDDIGFQLDTLYRQAGSINAGGVAAHLFTRDPDAYLAGATTQWNNVEGSNVFRVGAETEAYLSDFTVSPSLGLQRGDINSGTDPYYDVDLSYYATDNLKLTLNATGFEHNHGGSVQVEWQPDDQSPFSLYAMVGDSNVARTYALAGIRFTFGSEGQSVKYRDRHSDPKNIVTPLDNIVGNSYKTIAAGCIPAPSPAPACG